MKEGNNTKLSKRIEAVITWVKRHNGHVKAQEYEAQRQSAPVKATDIKPAEQDFGPVIQIDPNAREEENIAQHHGCSKRDIHNFNLHNCTAFYYIMRIYLVKIILAAITTNSNANIFFNNGTGRFNASFEPR
jgi:hypothetical protein